MNVDSCWSICVSTCVVSRGRRRMPRLSKLGFRLALCTLGAGVFAGGLPALAQAENIVPNPSFEIGCSTVPGDRPNNWMPYQGAVIGCSTTARTATFGMSVNPSVSGAGISSCVTRPLAGSYAVSFAYQATEAVEQVVSFGAIFFDDASCGVSSTQAQYIVDGTITTGSFELVSGELTAPTGTDSVLFLARVECPSSGCPVIFDDLSFDAPVPTAVGLRSLAPTATMTRNGALVRWKTSSEADVMGFQVYREVSGRRAKVNRSLIPAKGGVAGAVYSFLDRRSPSKELRYWIHAVRLDGTIAWVAPAHGVNASTPRRR